MRDETYIAVTLVVTMALAGVLAGFAAWQDSRHSLYIEAVVRGYAEYCPASDDLRWIGECE